MNQFAPDFEIEIEDELIPPELRGCITGVTFQSGLEGASRVEVTVANPNLRWLDHPLLQMDNTLNLSLGYAPDPLEKMFFGEITGVNASFPNGGMPTLTIVTHDFLQRLTQGTKDRAFFQQLPCVGKFPLPDATIARLLSVENLLIPRTDLIGGPLSFLILLLAYAIDPLEAKRGIRVQHNQSDFEFLSQLARENGWSMYIDHSEGFLKRGHHLRFQFLIQDYSPAVTLKWGESLLDFTPRISTVGQVEAVTTRIWLSSIKLEIVVVLGWDYDRTAFDLMIFPSRDSVEELIGSTKAKSALKIDVSSPALAPKELLGGLLPRLNNRLTGSGSAIGDTRIRPGQVINFEGLGGEFSGLYRVTSATHTLDSGGYRTQFEVRKEVWFSVISGLKGLVRGIERSVS